MVVARDKVEGFYHAPRVLFYLDRSIIKSYNQYLGFISINLHKIGLFVLQIYLIGV